MHPFPLPIGTRPNRSQLKQGVLMTSVSPSAAEAEVMTALGAARDLAAAGARFLAPPARDGAGNWNPTGGHRAGARSATEPADRPLTARHKPQFHGDCGQASRRPPTGLQPTRSRPGHQKGCRAACLSGDEAEADALPRWSAAAVRSPPSAQMAPCAAGPSPSSHGHAAIGSNCGVSSSVVWRLWSLSAAHGGIGIGDRFGDPVLVGLHKNCSSKHQVDVVGFGGAAQRFVCALRTAGRYGSVARQRPDVLNARSPFSRPLVIAVDEGMDVRHIRPIRHRGTVPSGFSSVVAHRERSGLVSLRRGASPIRPATIPQA
jgi:hypothetical protein